MGTKKIRNNRSYKAIDKNERDFPPSQTQPDQVMSLETLIRRHSNGQITERVGYYDENFPEMENVYTMDKMELAEYGMLQGRRVKAMEERLKQIKKDEQLREKAANEVAKKIAQQKEIEEKQQKNAVNIELKE